MYAERAQSLLTGLVEEDESQHDGVSMVTEFAHDEPFEIDQRVRIAVDNLLENAIEHNERPVTVTLRTERDGDGRLRISVEDDGSGIPKTEQSVLMGEQEITPLSHGSGLGLWLVVWVAQTVGGEVEFDESETGGSVITLIIPHRQTDLDESDGTTSDV
ncbi:ATP-binding protein [Natronoarchaeum sp. GCM10025703]|uniref:ATP-binding protein n=1 Tax=Natronoarchaeum sp. GCM10025703 TaxID=3252685 RepID=UPI00362057BE